MLILQGSLDIRFVGNWRQKRYLSAAILGAQKVDGLKYYCSSVSVIPR